MVPAVRPVRPVRPPPPQPAAVNRPLTVNELLDEARAKAPGAAHDPVPIANVGANADPSHQPVERPMCCICQDFVSADPNENTCPPCGHVFHAECVRRLHEVAAFPKGCHVNLVISGQHFEFQVSILKGALHPFKVAGCHWD